MYSTGMTGQSSGRTKWVTPNVYQSTTSVSVTSPLKSEVPQGKPVAAFVLIGVLTHDHVVRRAGRA